MAEGWSPRKLWAIAVFFLFYFLYKKQTHFQALFLLVGDICLCLKLHGEGRGLTLNGCSLAATKIVKADQRYERFTLSAKGCGEKYTTQKFCQEVNLRIG